MSQKYEKLKTLLKELFQLDQPDLDFGLYRVMHAKSAEVSQFLDKDLLPQVQAAFGLYKNADKAEIEKDLAKAIEQAQALGADPESLPKVKDLRARLKNDAVDVGALESEVYDHLFSFFRRYYSEGDFLAKRVYKPGVYAIPYEGEEVSLHWANKDQYYIKTSEYLRDYAFRLRPDDDKMPMRVHFRLADVAEGEHGNVKAAEGKERRFRLVAENSVALEAGELVVRFTYQPDPVKQKELNAAAEQTVLASGDVTLAAWIAELGKLHVRADGTSSGTRLRMHLDRYTARNTFDYFIHKDLGGFLRRELDFFIKNEVMHLDDVENETAPRVEQYLSKIKVIRKIAGKIIAFLAQLEDFQKKLWLKKKFVVETQYCITLGCIPEAFYAEIAANDAQREEWVKLFAIDEIKGDLTTPGYSKKLKPAFLKANPTLVVDTRHFDGDFTARLLEAMGNVEAQVDGVAIHSENSQALTLIRSRFRGQVACAFIDPPYNTGNDGFAYKDEYAHSSWLSMIEERLTLARCLLAEGGTLWCVLDGNEAPRLWQVGDLVFGASAFVGHVVWQHSVQTKGYAGGLALSHNNIFCWSNSVSPTLGTLERTDENNQAYSNPDNDTKGAWRTGYLVNSLFRPNLKYDVVSPSGKSIPPPDNGWRYSRETMASKLRTGEIFFSPDETRLIRKIYLADQEGHVPNSLWLAKDSGSSRSGNLDLKSIVPASMFTTSKPIALLKKVFTVADTEDALILDYFAGSGASGHAVINLNREDGGQRKFILVEMGDYFDTVLLPRIKKVTFTPEWKDGKPKRLATPEEAKCSPRIVKVIRLESYEDTLNNLETRRTKSQQLLLEHTAAQGTDGLKEHYLLRYMLDVETRGSQSLLNVQAFTDPTAYKLKVKRPGSDESREVNVDLLETFNWLIGLTVRHIAAPQSFSAAFERDSEKRLRVKGRLKEIPPGPPLPKGGMTWWFRIVTGTTPDGRKTLIIWRKLTGEPEQDNPVLDEWFTKQGYSAKDSEFDLIYVNGGNNLENLKTPDDTWKVRLIEEDFHRLMFEAQEV